MPRRKAPATPSSDIGDFFTNTPVDGVTEEDSAEEEASTASAPAAPEAPKRGRPPRSAAPLADNSAEPASAVSTPAFWPNGSAVFQAVAEIPGWPITKPEEEVSGFLGRMLREGQGYRVWRWQKGQYRDLGLHRDHQAALQALT